MTRTPAPGRGHTVLRRRSWPVLCGIALVALGIGMAAAVLKVTSVNGFRGGWQGIPVYLALAGVLGRIANCKVVLREDDVLVVNPLRSHTLPRSAITAAEVDDHGTLELRLDEDHTVGAFAFGGSLVDRVRGTSEQAARTVTAWLDAPHSPPPTATPRAHWTRAPYADAALTACAVTAAVGAVWMGLSG
ncbi:hypothetical protein [Streptomyces flavalbus]|uniref:PH domain-containing protein n=1 Tax=Streptomyces flavalbus TaxID=2665155 RepID=A0ABW2WEV1_9ACTN